jgi:head-tail adaptor
MRPGRLNKWVTLANAPDSTPDSDGFFEPLSPPGVWAQIDPFPPLEADSERTQAHTVIIRYHPQVTMDTRILFGTRELFVKGVQNINEKGAWMRLHCEEVVR